jgi:hypothetical protein
MIRMLNMCDALDVLVVYMEKGSEVERVVVLRLQKKLGLDEKE